jgi:hypothetical protein
MEIPKEERKKARGHAAEIEECSNAQQGRGTPKKLDLPFQRKRKSSPELHHPDSAGAKVAVKPASNGRDGKHTARKTESPTRVSTSPQQRERFADHQQ